MNAAGRTLKANAARCLDAAMRATDVSNVQLAALCGCAESRVRRWRSDDDADLDATPPLTLLLVAHPKLGDAILAELRAARGESRQTVESLAVAMLKSDNAVHAVVLDALADDGKITSPEVPAIEAEMDRAAATIAAFRSSLKAVRFK